MHWPTSLRVSPQHMPLEMPPIVTFMQMDGATYTST
jgi:hypothetical protein